MALQPNDDSGKRIESCQLKAKDIHTRFGNPRKITKKEKEKLRKSLEMFGDFGVFLINETDDVIAGNQRLSVIMEIDPDTLLDCKRLIGYTEAELRAINIKDNTHSGEWDLDMLSSWTADLNIDLGITTNDVSPDKRKIKDMELIRYEKYDYVMIVCRNEVDYLNLCRILGIDDAKVLIAKRRRIKARAIWFEDMQANIVPKKHVTLVTEEDLDGHAEDRGVIADDGDEDIQE